MTTTLIRTTQAVAEWTKVFPRQVTETYTSSVTFMKQLTVVALSTITYLKNAFPEDNYTIDQFGGLKIRVLKTKCEDDLAQFLITALTQAFEAFDKKYLHQIALCFYEESCQLENLIEYHVFEYTYGEGGVTMNLSSKNREGGASSLTCTFENVRERTIQLIRACMVMLSQSQLPKTYDVSLRLYYNEAYLGIDAPEGYQAPGFVCARLEDENDPILDTLSDSIRLGSVRTPFHSLLVRTFHRDLRPASGNSAASREPVASQNPPTISQAPEDFSTGSQLESGCVRGSVQCECRMQDEEPNLLLTCQYCARRQHAVCYGRLRAPPAHCCADCGDHDAARRADCGLLRAPDRACYAIFRRALWWLRSTSHVSAEALGARLQLPGRAALKLLRVLHSHAVIAKPPPDLTTEMEVVSERLEAVISEHFHTSDEEDDDVLTRLVEESIASQEAQSDPIGEVLDPMEKVSLRNASEIGRIIPSEASKISVKDVTLEQYREALVSIENVDGQLPLSGSHNPVQDMETIGKKRKREGNQKQAKTGVKNKKVKNTRK